MLAAALLREQGLQVLLLCFSTPFFSAQRARQSSGHLGLPLREVDLTAHFLPLLQHPPHGFGRGHNPCIDCHLLMLRQAAALLTQDGYQFLFTGEVLGQRPMSQNRGALNLIARESGLADLILRPLSAKLLLPTTPELLGWVDRERLLDLSGRSRKRQIALARELGLTQYPAPAGGCLLTDPHYAGRMKELLQHDPAPARRDLELLQRGRHFRLAHGAKAIVGRTKSENEAILALSIPEDLIVKTQDYPGPIVLLTAGASPVDRETAAGLAAAYSDAPEGVEVSVSLLLGQEQRLLYLTKESKGRFKEWLL